MHLNLARIPESLGRSCQAKGNLQRSSRGLHFSHRGVKIPKKCDTPASLLKKSLKILELSFLVITYLASQAENNPQEQYHNHLVIIKRYNTAYKTWLHKRLCTLFQAVIAGFKSSSRTFWPIYLLQSFLS